MPRNDLPYKDRYFFLSISLLVILLNIVPFVMAALAGGNEFLFNGTLLNPLDGQTYLAKMYQGLRGDWQFTLPYTVNPGEGANLNMFYIFLGKFAGFFGFSLIFTFTLGRVFGGVLLLFALARFFTCTITDARPRRIAFALAALGSGMGWITIPFGGFTSDFWVAETYPFLSIYDNPHFPLGLALVLFLLTYPALYQGSKRSSSLWVGLGALGLSFLLGWISPFGVVIVVVVMGGGLLGVSYRALLSGNWREFFSSPQIFHLFWIIVGGVPVLGYQFWAIRSDPVLAGWDAQNITVTPPWWDVLISLSPAILLAFVGIRQTRPGSPAFVNVVWVISGLILILIPFGLQRRFMVGLFVPVAGLAALGLEALSKGKRSQVRWLVIGLFLLSLPTNLVVILAGQSGARAHDLALFRTQDESSAFAWLEAETQEDALILAAPGTGLLIPAFSGRQVIYGHPFETVYAEKEEQTVIEFYASMTDAEARELLSQRGVDFVFFGPRERAMGDVRVEQGLILVFEMGEVQLYQVEK